VNPKNTNILFGLIAAMLLVFDADGILVVDELAFYTSFNSCKNYRNV